MQWAPIAPFKMEWNDFSKELESIRFREEKEENEDMSFLHFLNLNKVHFQ